MKRSPSESNYAEESNDEDEIVTNPYTNCPYSREYFKILKQRKLLPVFEYKDRIKKDIIIN